MKHIICSLDETVDPRDPVQISVADYLLDNNSTENHHHVSKPLSSDSSENEQARRAAVSRPKNLKQQIKELEKRWQTIRKDLKKYLNIDIEEEEPGVNYECQYCGTKFRKPCSLGGHISRVHRDRK